MKKNPYQSGNRRTPYRSGNQYQRGNSSSLTNSAFSTYSTEQQINNLKHNAAALAGELNKLARQENLSEKQKNQIRLSIEEKAVEFMPSMRDRQFGNFINGCRNFIKKQNLSPDIIDAFKYGIGKNLNNFDPISLSLVLNGLAQMGFEKSELGINPRDLKTAINGNLTNADPQHLANTLNGLAKMGFEKSELGIDQIALKASINRNLTNANPQDLSNILNGLAKMGFEKSDLEINQEALETAINQNLSQSDPQNLANILNGSLNLGFVDEDFLSKNAAIIKNAAEGLKIESISLESVTSLARFDSYCYKALGQKELFSQKFRENLRKAHKDLSAEKTENRAKLEKKVEAGFKKIEGVTLIEDSKTIPWVGIPVLEPDIQFKYSNFRFYIEVDGPTHFNGNSAEGFVLNGQTTIRNKLYQGFLKESEKLIFISLPFFEIDKIVKKDEAQLPSYLQTKLNSAIEEKKKNPVVEKSTSSKPKTTSSKPQTTSSKQSKQSSESSSSSSNLKNPAIKEPLKSDSGKRIREDSNSSSIDKNSSNSSKKRPLEPDASQLKSPSAEQVLEKKPKTI